MNRFIAVPCALSIVLLAGWYVGQPVNDPSENLPRGPDADVKERDQNTPNTPADIHATDVDWKKFGVEVPEQELRAIDLQLITKWKTAVASPNPKYGFSRLAIKEKDPANDYLVDVDFSQRHPDERLLSGSFVVSFNEDSLRFPMIVNRQNNKCSIFANGQWHDFDDWKDHRAGVFRQ